MKQIHKNKAINNDVLTKMRNKILSMQKELTGLEKNKEYSFQLFCAVRDIRKRWKLITENIDLGNLNERNIYLMVKTLDNKHDILCNNYNKIYYEMKDLERSYLELRKFYRSG